MGWDSIRWDQNQLETSIGEGFLSQFPFVNLRVEMSFVIECSKLWLSRQSLLAIAY